MPKTPSHTVALFGETEKGQYQKAYRLSELAELVDCFGNPPPESIGLFFAVQAILYQRELIFFRVEEEGYSIADYLFGLSYLEDAEKVKKMHAICLPGIGDPKILAASQKVCEKRKSFLIITQKDLFDYLTA